MLYFLFFILGIFFIQFIIPLLDSLFSLLFMRIEVTKGKFALQTTEINKNIKEISGEDEFSP